MIGLELASASNQIVNEYLKITPDDEVFVLTDGESINIARSVAIPARAAGATTLVSIMPLLKNQNQEPPRLVAKSLETADVAITATTHSITHTDAFRNAGDTRIGVLRSVTEEMMTQGAMTADYAELRRHTEAVADLLESSDRVRVTSDKGMDVEFSIEGRPSFSLDGYLHERDDYGLIAQFPPGEAPVAPVEGTTNGTIVVDVSIDEIGKLDSEITLKVEDGCVTDIVGGEQADTLREIIEQGDNDASNIAEFAIGTNPKANLIGNIAEDKKKEGTVHFAVGDNMSMGGDVQSDIHLDGVVQTPTVEIDGITVLEDGRINWDSIL
jgi:leucyl aminopeptidase (aminopeptidase T)